LAAHNARGIADFNLGSHGELCDFGKQKNRKPVRGDTFNDV
jgi:hypothetical protein